MVCIDLKFGSNVFHNRIVDGKNDLENISKLHLGTLYCEEFLGLLLLSTKYSLRQSFKYSGAILLWIVYNIQYFKVEIRVACRRLLYSVIWTDHESYRRTTTLVKSMITVVSLRELHAYILRININNFNNFMHWKTEISITWQLRLI